MKREERTSSSNLEPALGTLKFDTNSLASAEVLSIGQGKVDKEGICAGGGDDDVGGAEIAMLEAQTVEIEEGSVQ